MSADGWLAVVGLGPGDPRWLLPEARATIEAADHLVGYQTYLDLVPADLVPGKALHGSDNRVEVQRAGLALDLAAAGERVAVVSSGDPGVFAMASAVLEVACEPRFADVPVRVLPGLTAAHAVASRAGAPLGHDYCVLSLSDLLKPWEVVAERISAAARADLVLAIYNPASKTRTWQVGAMRDLLLEHRDQSTPVVIGRDVSGPREEVKVVRLADLDPAEIDMRCLLIIGSSQTQWYDDRVFTPRQYPTL
ncbi:MAG: precorrin-3B C(17)-methyltransferase [Aquihabitans sp.]